MRKQLYLLYLLLLSVQLAFAQTARYEYWLDNDHKGRTIVANNVTDVTLDLDIGALKPGLHYFSFRTQSESGQWGGLSRYLFLIREEADATSAPTTQYEYWLDNNYEQRTMVKGAATDIPLSLDISSLKPGLHYFSFRAQGKSGQWGGLSRYLFFMKQDAIGQLVNIDYWIDERKDVMTQQVTDSTVVITMDITNLSVGNHTFNIEGRTLGDYSGLLASYEFVNSELPVVPDPIISHEGNIITITAADLAQADSLNVNPTYYYTLDGTEPDTLSTKYEGPFEVTRNCIVKAKGFQNGFIDSQVDSLVVDWFKVAAPTFRFEGDNLFIETATKDASIFYQMADLPNMDEATVEKISEGLTVTADAQQSIFYEQPIELKKSVVLKAIAAGAKVSEVSTLVYDYDGWQKLLAALDYGRNIIWRAES